MSPSPSVSPSMSPSPSVSPSMSPSPSVSPSMSPSPSPSPSPFGYGSSSSSLIGRLLGKEAAQPGYIAEVKERGKWKKINPKKPLTREMARRLSKRVTDRTLGASGRITPSKKSALLGRVEKMAAQGKFRMFRISKGKKVPMKDQWIEKRKFRLDNKKETQTLAAYKRSAEFKNLIKKPKRRPAKSRKKGKGRKSNIWGF